MTASAATTGPSLLPYLNHDKSGLRLGLVHGPTARLSTMETAGPLTGILEAKVTAGGGDGITEIFLLIQPDQYDVVPSELVPLTNRDVDALWQAASQTKTSRSSAGFWLFPEQMDDQGRLVPWRSLFFCSETQRYGHALCPHCGAGLTMCRDDDVLQNAGLPQYSASLTRFLYCPTCLAETRTPCFYAREAPPTPPSCLFGSNQLIRGFGRLLTRQDLAADLPCIGCEQAATCHGPEMRIQERMIPLFFFPFHMLAQPAPSVNLLDFLPLLSGAGIEQTARALAPAQKEGRLRKLHQCQPLLADGQGLLFSGTDKAFAEALYLKLTLLGDMWDTLTTESAHLPEPVAAMSLESFWVTLPVQSTRLPLFWNFSLELIDRIGRPTVPVASNPLDRAHLKLFMGTAWLHTLLVNRHQDMRTVQAAVYRYLAARQAKDPLVPSPGVQDEAVFDANNLFWRSSAAPQNAPSIDSQMLGWWHLALDLGFALLEAGRTADPSWSDTSFQEQFEDLRQSLHAALFRRPSPTIPIADDQRSLENEKIATILRSIAAHWPPTVPHPVASAIPNADLTPAATPSPIPDGDGDFQETIILGPDSAFEEPESTATEPYTASGPSKAPAQIDGASDDLEATILLDPGPPSDSRPPLPVQPNQMEQTLIPTPHANDTGDHDDLEATILIRPVTGRPRHPDALASPSVGPQTAPGRPPAPHADQDDDDLAQTVILSPEHNKERKPKP